MLPFHMKTRWREFVKYFRHYASLNAVLEKIEGQRDYTMTEL